MDLKDLSQYRYLLKALKQKKRSSAEYKRLFSRAQGEREKIEKYIDGIDDERVRYLFVMRFIYCYSWVKIAIEYGGGNTADSCKKIVYRKILSQKRKLSLF